MARTNPLGKIKDVAAGGMKAPVAAAGTTVGLAKDAARYWQRALESRTFGQVTSRRDVALERLLATRR